MPGTVCPLSLLLRSPRQRHSRPLAHDILRREEVWTVKARPKGLGLDGPSARAMVYRARFPGHGLLDFRTSTFNNGKIELAEIDLNFS